MVNPIQSIMTHSIVTSVLQMNNAKVISICLVIVIVAFQSIQYLDMGPNIACDRLLNGGEMVDKEDGVWSAAGCMIHNYKRQESLDCLENENIAFVGDSRIRELFYDVAKSIVPEDKIPEGKIHSNIYLEHEKRKINFYWLPELNHTNVLNLYHNWLKNTNEAPTYIFQSAGTHTMKRLNNSDQGRSEFEKSFINYSNIIKQLVEHKQTMMFWIMQGPVYEDMLSTPRRMITNDEIYAYNNIVQKVFKKEKINFMQNSNVFSKIESYYIQESADGLHIPAQALAIESSVILNIICNDKIKPIDGSCCQRAPPFTAAQVLLATCAAFCLVFYAVLKLREDSNPRYMAVNGNDVEAAATDKQLQEDPTKQLTKAFIKMFLILLYFYICDRTKILMDTNKHFTLTRFFIPLIYVCVLGVFGIEQTKQSVFLNRDQTDEWKGWMQLVILIYHMSGASVHVPIYMNIRLLVAMYLFMTGYGHFSYFWHKGDYSLYRVLNVLFRLNFLTVCLCYVMIRPYQFYYYVPLCTFWFLLLYFAMALWPQVNVKKVPQSSINGNATGNGTTNGNNKETAKSLHSTQSIYLKMSFKLALFAIFVTFILLSQV